MGYHSNRYNPSYNQKNRNQNKPVIKSRWKQIFYDLNNEDDKKKISQIIKYGQRSNLSKDCTFTEYLIFYGTRILHTNINGDIIGLYSGGIEAWEQWFYAFLGNNITYDLDKVFSRIDLFGLSMICGINMSRNKEYGYKITMAIIKKGWLDGLKYIVEKLKIIHIDNQFELLVEA